MHPGRVEDRVILTDHPAPPIPEDADLRHMPSYMIDVQSLLDSDLAAFGDPAANWYAVLTWCAALHQIPAGSLPDDDAVLAYLVRLGRDVRTWRKFREKGALRGWVKHSDGRLYHPVVTKKVLDLWGKSRAGKAAVEAREAAKIAQAIEKAKAEAIDRSSTDAKSIQQNDNKGREGKGIEEKGREERVGLTANLSTNIPALFDPPQELIPPEKPAKKPRAAPKKPLDPNWTPSTEDWKYAAEKGFTGPRIDGLAEAFRNNHLGKGTVMANPSGYWRTWITNEIKWYGPPNGSGGPGPRPPARSRADTAIEGIFSGLTEEDLHGRNR